MTPVITDTVPSSIRVDERGELRVGDSRVLVWLILELYLSGESAETLHSDFPSASVADIHGTIAHYHRHRVEMDAYLAQCRREGDDSMKLWRDDARSQNVHEKFRKMRDQWRANSDWATR